MEEAKIKEQTFSSSHSLFGLFSKSRFENCKKARKFSNTNDISIDFLTHKESLTQTLFRSKNDLNLISQHLPASLVVARSTNCLINKGGNEGPKKSEYLDNFYKKECQGFM